MSDTIMSIEEFCAKHNACTEGATWARQHCQTMQEAWDRAPDPRWVVWIATRPGVLTQRDLVRFALQAARRVEPLMPQAARDALEVVEQGLRGEATRDAIRAAAEAAWDAARAVAWAAWVAGAAGVADKATWIAARAAAEAAWAAGAAGVADAAGAAWDAADAAADAAWTAARAAARAAAWAADAAWLRANVTPSFRITLNAK